VLAEEHACPESAIEHVVGELVGRLGAEDESRDPPVAKRVVLSPMGKLNTRLPLTEETDTFCTEAVSTVFVKSPATSMDRRSLQAYAMRVPPPIEFLRKYRWSKRQYEPNPANSIL